MVTAAAHDQPLDLCLLGPLTVTVAGRSVPVGGPRQMAVLACLMLTPNQVVTMDQLVESVWDGDEPAQPQVAIRSYVSNLRRAIEPNRRRRAADSCLASSPPGYRLAIDPVAVDWIRFERLVDQGRYQLSTGDHDRAIERLQQARGLWRGEPCSGLPDSNTFLAHRGRLTKLRETALELLFESLLRRGDHATVAAEVEAAIAENPLRERLTELGMVAFYRSGRQSEALALGQRLRARLLEELGIDPSPSIDAIELKILNHDESLDPAVDEPPTESQAGGAAAAVTSQPTHPFPADGIDRADVEQPLYPGCRRRLVGRRSEQRALAAIGPALAAGHSVAAVITGEQGIGKTTLARAVAGRLIDDGTTVAWGRSVRDEAATLWPWAQVVLSLLEELAGSDEASEKTAGLDLTDLAPLAALGPSVAAALRARVQAGRAGQPDGFQTVDEPRRSEADGMHDGADQDSVNQDSVNQDSVNQDSVNQDYDSPGPVEIALSTAGRWSGPGRGDRPEIMLAVTRLLERAAKAGPVVCIFEDLHWADRATIGVLGYAASTLADHPVGFVLTWTDPDPSPSLPATGLRELSRLPALLRVELGGLDETEIVELVEAGGRTVTPVEAAELRRRSGGNPLFVREILAHPDGSVGPEGYWSTLIDAVVDRVERLDSGAGPVLGAAALFRRPFTAAALTLLCEHSPERIQGILDESVRSGLLIEEEPTAGSYRFRHSVVGEVLAAELLAVERAAKHETAGHHLLSVDGSSYEVAHHLSHSRSADDRLLAARIAFDLLHRDSSHGEFEVDRIAEVDRCIEIGLAATGPSRPGRSRGAGPRRDRLVIDALSHRSWRAWIDGHPAEWLEHGARGLRLALEELADLPPAPTRRVKHPVRAAQVELSEEVDEFDRLCRATTNMIGAPTWPTGPTRTSDLVELPQAVLDDLAAAADRLPVDNPARWAAQVHLARLAQLALRDKSGSAIQAKAVREATKLLSAARRKLSDPAWARVAMVVVARHGDAMEPTARLGLLREIVDARQDREAELFLARHAYPSLLELDSTDEAERSTREAMASAEASGSAFLLAEARLLAARHWLWTGQLERAGAEIERSLAEWRANALLEPIPVVHQLRTLRLLERRPLEAGHRQDGDHRLSADRAGLAELALQLARLGDIQGAREALDRVLDSIGVRQLSLPELSFVAVAAGLVGHERAASAVQELLTAAEDRLVVRPDGSVILGPASLYAGLAANAAGRSDVASSLYGQAMRATHRYGGSSASLNVVIADLGADSESNRLPTNS